MRRREMLYTVGIFVCLLYFVFSSAGCEPLRKKFIREKKKDKQSQRFIPVLEPEEYPVKMISAQEQYRYHYSLWKVWYRDFIQAIDDNSSGKRQVYLLAQQIKELEKMGKLLVDERSQALKPVIEDLRGVVRQLGRPEKLRNSFSIKKSVNAAAKKVRMGFRPKEAVTFLK